MKLGSLTIDPWNPAQVNPNSYNLRLGPKLMVYVREEVNQPYWLPPTLDMKLKPQVRECLIPPDGYVLQPGVLYLGSTLEYTETHGYVPIIEGRSSVGRLGLCIHVTAGFGDCGFCGHWTLEMTVVHPLRIYAGVEICQIAYTTLVGEPLDYRGKYQHQGSDPRPSGFYREFLKQGEANATGEPEKA